jgi:threonine dehydratase
MTGPENQDDALRVPTLDDIAAQRIALRPYIRVTPVFGRDDLPGLPGTKLLFKFEHLQATGTFKARGAFSNLLALDNAGRANGVTAISAGNHAVAVAYAAQHLGIDAKVVMLSTANPARVALARRLGAQVLMAADGAAGFAMVAELQQREGRAFVHPFNFFRTVLGTATLGAEWAEQALASEFAGLDAVIVPIGGGGLAAGVATAFKRALPGIAVYGVEPEGADGMLRSFAANGPVRMGPMQGIADSLMAPHTEAYSFELCRNNIDALVTVDDEQLRAAMRLLFEELKLAVEPACAAATAGALGPLRERIAGRRVGVLLCGSITDPATFARHMAVA